MRARVALAAALALAPSAASAGGFYMTDRGVRPLGRGGAFVAGADDQHAVWYNPAGLVSAGRGLLLDASLVNFNNTFTREARPAGGGSVVTFRAVEGEGAPLPIPTLVVTHDLGVRNAMFAAGVFAPYAAIASYDRTRDAPQRYSLVSLDGSMLAVAGLWAAWRPHPTLAIGGGVSALLGSFTTQLAFSACPATVTCAPENPDWDAVAQLAVGPIAAPTASLGVQFSPHRMVTFGLSGQLPLWVDAAARLSVRLPRASFYEGASVQGDQANVRFNLAPVVRAGIEVRPVTGLRAEFAFVWEGWSMHDRIDLTPRGIGLRNVRGVGDYQISALSIDRGFRDVLSFRLGVENHTRLGGAWSIEARVGASYETSATAPAYTSVLTMDANKWVAALGASLGYGRWRFDATFAYMIADTVTVAPSEARLLPTQALRTGPGAPSYPVNAGRYELNVNVVGLGVRYAFGS
ncbi:MAG: outer membrane protein transport protein [Polyangiales bacterium]